LIKLYIPDCKSSGQPIFEIFEKSEQGEIRIATLASPFFQLCQNPKDADWISIPFFSSGMTGPEGKNLILQAHVIAEDLGKPFAIFSNSDIIVDPKVSPVFIFSPGTYARMENQVELPALLPYDPIHRWQNGNWAPKIFKGEIEIGFCGQATLNPLKFLKDWYTIESLRCKKKNRKSPFLYIPRFLPAFERGRLLHSLENSKGLKTNFLFRSHYKAGATTTANKNKVEKEFYENIYSNLFTLCLRGMGNYSVRFYQTLAMGRIPVLIDTDSNLPFSDQIDYKNIVVKVPFSDRFNTEDYLIDFLKNKTNSDLVKIQEACRSVWVDHFNSAAMLENLSIKMKSLLNRFSGTDSKV
jgi:hypothetical protein